MKKKIAITLLTSVAFVASSHAAIIVQDSYLNSGDTTGTTTVAMTATTGEVWTIPSTVLDLSAATSDKLVISVAQRREVGQTVTFGGVTMATAAFQSGVGSNDGFAAVYYLDTFTLGGDLVITSNGTLDGNKGDLSGISVMVYLLSGTAAGGPALTDTDDGAGGTSVSLTTGANGGFVISATGTYGNPTSESFTSGNVGTADAGNSQQAAWSGITATTYSYSTTGSDGGAVMVSFAPIPEPSSLALLGAAGGILTLRRRRQG